MLLLSACWLSAAVAVPAYQRWNLMTVVGGEQVQATLCGDEFMHYYQSADGRKFLLGDGGLLEPMTAGGESLMEQRHSARMAQRAMLAAAGKAPTRGLPQPPVAFRGTLRQLVILVSFPDMRFKDEAPLQLWNGIFNTPGYSEGNFMGSVHDYFYEQSYHQFDLQFDVHYVQADESYTYYGRNTSSGDDAKIRDLIVEVCRKVAAEVGDWSPYDWNGDGLVEQVFILYAGKGENDGGNEMTIWPHQWWLDSPVQIAGGYSIYNYGCFAELDGQGTYGTFGVLCHEYSHCLGLPDLYMTVSPYSNTVGEFSLLDYGCYNGNGFQPLGYSAFERYALGWLQPTELTEPLTVAAMQPLSVAGEAYTMTNDADDNEFYILENRQHSGWDITVPDTGVVVWHIAYSEKAWKDNVVNNTSSMRRVAIVPASNYSGTLSQSMMTYRRLGLLARWAYPYDGNDSLTTTSLPAATWFTRGTDGSTYLTDRAVTDIKINDAGKASFKYRGGSSPSGIAGIPADGDQVVAVYTLDGRQLPLGGLSRAGVFIIRCKSGRTCKVILPLSRIEP